MADQVVLLLDDVINQLNNNQGLLKFISKNLSYNVYNNAVQTIYKKNEESITNIFNNGIKSNGEKLKHPKVLLSMIMELVGSTCYHSILYSEPLPIQEYKPILYNNIRIMLEDPIN